MFELTNLLLSYLFYIDEIIVLLPYAYPKLFWDMSSFSIFLCYLLVISTVTSNLPISSFVKFIYYCLGFLYFYSTATIPLSLYICLWLFTPAVI